MGLFDLLFTRKVHVNVMGNKTLDGGDDGRYERQASRNRREADRKMKAMEFKPHTTDELRAFIEETYQVSELPVSDERYKRAYMNVKHHLVMEHAPELLKLPEPVKPKHPPVSDSDPDYEVYYKAERARFQEAVMLPRETFPIRLHVYSIPIIINNIPIAWVEVSVESEYQYLVLKTIELECETHYSIDKVKAEIIKYFGASLEDQKANNERYLQLLAVQ